ncbi:5-bromo-4-chloroindolyl phosphate hydrolysis family protein [Lapidilactobacillus wuchangensis]|uniref:5-bromo-4-chloroindolyl phosphate hydrolysis family protein n=1 Tax=Lapidilactobacillus wuchangensis TaxID=2486001 RepID=UPI000F7901DF|nr:5-bromo-4-chloroindolyl phosphate hydrolysis family protein [Lapidilactobacillus wuchangensis]
MTFKKIMRVLLTAWVIIFASCSVLAYDDHDGFRAMLVFTLIGVVLLFLTHRGHREQRSDQQSDSFDAPISKKMLTHYQQSGLSDAEIKVFRDTMADAKKEIVTLDTTMQQVPKLRAINLNHDTINLSKALFAALVKEPDRLQEAAPFLYKHLPTSVQIAKKYEEISHHELKTSDTYAVMDRSVEMLAALSEQIKHDYLDFVSEDVSDLKSTLDSVNEKHDQPDFSSQSDQTIAQMQAELNQIQHDYLSTQAEKEAAKQQPTPTNPDTSATNDSNQENDEDHHDGK